jgi:class 3 adenylate cyclase
MTDIVSPPAANLSTEGMRAVVVVDMVESVRMMEIDEEGTVRRWQALVALIEARLLREHRGRLVKSTGDGLVLDFDDASAALRFAFDLVELCERLNAEPGQGLPLRLRVGAHVGRVFADGHDIHGRAVNLAARVMTLAEPGEIVVSAEFRDRLVQRLDALIEDLGLCYLKHIREPVRAYRLYRNGEAASRPRSVKVASELRPAVAVIPFMQDRPDAETAAVGDALVDDIIAALSRATGITVVSRLSTAPLRGRDCDLASIRRLLGVAYVVSGTFHTAAGVARVHAELCDARDGRVLWADRLQARVDDLFQGQDAMVPRIVAQVSRAVVAVELRRVRSIPIPSLEGYSLFIGGVTLLHRLSSADFFRARELLDHVAEREPRCAAPLAMMAKWHILRLVQGWSSDPLAQGHQAQACARRALHLEPDHAFSLAIDGLVSCHVDKDLDAAALRCEAAVQANPQEPYAWAVMSGLHSYRGHAEAAQAAAERAIDLSPLDPARFVFEAYAASAMLVGGRHDEAIALARSSIRSNALHAPSHRLLVIGLQLAGHEPQARQAAAALMQVEPQLTVQGYLTRYPGRDHAHAAVFSSALRSAGVPA